MLRELLRWGMPFMEEGPAEGDVFRGQWMTWGAETALTDREPEAPPVTVQVLADEEPAYIEVSRGAVHVPPAAPRIPGRRRGPVRPILGLLTGHIDLTAATDMGVDTTAS